MRYHIAKELLFLDPKLEKTLSSFLYPDERVLWRGKTKPFGILEGKEGKHVLLQWILSVAGGALLLALAAANGTASAGLVVLTLLVVALLVAAPVFSFRALLAQGYFITDRRVLVLRPDGGGSMIAHENVDACRVLPLDHGGEAVVVGSELFDEGQSRLRWRALHPLEGHFAKSVEGLTECEGVVFYRVDGAADAAELLEAF